MPGWQGVEEGEYREYLTDERRSQAGCIGARMPTKLWRLTPGSLAILLVATACGNPASRALTPAPEATHVGRAVCAECHAEEASRWADSHHDLAMQEPNADTVLGDFAGATLDADGVSTRFEARDGGFFVQTEGSGGETREYEIAYVFGVEPLQQYLVGFPDAAIRPCARRGTRGLPRTEGSVGFTSIQVSASRPTTSFTGPGPTRTGTSCARSAIRRT